MASGENSNNLWVAPTEEVPPAQQSTSAEVQQVFATSMENQQPPDTQKQWIDAIESNSLDQTRLLLCKYPPTFDAFYRSLLKLAVTKGHASIFLELYPSAEPDAAKALRRESAGEDTLLHCAARLCSKVKEHAVSYEMILSSLLDTADPDELWIVNERNETPLHVAARNKNRRVLYLLLDKLTWRRDDPSNFNVVDNDGLSLLHIICTGPNSQLVEQFLQTIHASSINDTVSPTSNFCPGYSALHFAAAHDRFETLQILVKHKADLHATTSLSQTALHLACKMVDITWTLYELFLHRSGEEFSDAQMSDRVKAKVRERSSMIEYLCSNLKSGAINARDKAGNNAIIYLARNECAKCSMSHHIVEDALFHNLEYYLNVVYKGYKSDVTAILLRCTDEHGKRLCPEEVLNLKNKSGHTCLLEMVYVYYSNPKFFRFLVTSGADPNIGDKDYSTPLHIAVKKSRLDLVCELVDHNECNLSNMVNLDAQDKLGNTPLYYAFTNNANSKKNFLICFTLMDAGADLFIENEENETVVYEACIHVLSVMASKIQHIDDTDFASRFWKRLKLLQICGYYKEQLHNDFLADIEKYMTTGINREFIDSCQEEVERMKETRLSPFLTLYDMVNKSIDKVCSYTKSNELRKILESSEFLRQYPNYGNMIRGRFARALARESLMEDAIPALQNLIRLKFPESVIELILNFLNEEQLRNVIEADKLAQKLAEKRKADVDPLETSAVPHQKKRENC